MGTVNELREEGGNLHMTVKADFSSELKIDQSIAHNGACLTVDSLGENFYSVIAIEETLKKTNLKNLQAGEPINLERGMILGERLDGHIVQGHVDQTGICEEINKRDGSWEFVFSHEQSPNNLTLEKGSITINGVSLTVVESTNNSFSVEIIPYTFENTTFQFLKKGDLVNLEFDVIGKYVGRLLESKNLTGFGNL